VADVRRRLQDTKQRGYIGGVWAAWNWYGDPSGLAFATEVDRLVSQVAPNATPEWPRVMLDDERHEPATILALLRSWRRLRPVQSTAWTMESMQGGWMDAVFVQGVTDARVRLAPQCYTGDMVPVDPLAAVRDLTKRGFADALVTPLYDGKALQVGWEGFVWTMGRLPQ
jgi:hypothetical protein